jgi:hypothetical protein
MFPVDTPKATIVGQITLDSSVTEPLAGTDIRVSTVEADTTPGAVETVATSALAHDDLTFELKARPGRLVLVAAVPTGWVTRAVRYRGVDVTDGGIDVLPGERIGNIQIDVTSRVSVITGAVRNARNEVVSDYSVVVFPSDRDRRRTARYSRLAQPDQNGRFEMQGLPPGNYSMIAVDSLNGVEWNDLDFLIRADSVATTFSLTEGEVKSLDLVLVQVR